MLGFRKLNAPPCSWTWHPAGDSSSIQQTGTGRIVLWAKVLGSIYFQPQLWGDFIVCFSPIFLGSRNIHGGPKWLCTFPFRWWKMPPLALLKIPSFVHAERDIAAPSNFRGTIWSHRGRQSMWVQPALQTSSKDWQRMRRWEWGCTSTPLPGKAGNPHVQHSLGLHTLATVHWLPAAKQVKLSLLQWRVLRLSENGST